jgi:membrane protease YdiL (CAAX protease family)
MSRSPDSFRHACSDAASCAIAEPAPLLLPTTSARRSVSLAVETAAVTIAAVAAVRFLHVYRPAGLHWLLIPCTLVAAALAPTWIARRDFPRVGLHAEPIRLALRTVTLVCLCVLPPIYLGLWLLTSRGLPIPLRPTLAPGEDWLTWLLYQFLYVAAAEEVFFRGYLQANVMRILGMRHASRVVRGTPENASRTTHGAQRTTQEWIAITISAGCFALAHVVVQGQIVSALTFLPGLLMAWLFVRTRSLLAPILFHGLANVSYGILAATLA